jgi:hypothetical protein
LEVSTGIECEIDAPHAQRARAIEKLKHVQSLTFPNVPGGDYVHLTNAQQVFWEMDVRARAPFAFVYARSLDFQPARLLLVRDEAVPLAHAVTRCTSACAYAMSRSLMHLVQTLRDDALALTSCTPDDVVFYPLDAEDGWYTTGAVRLRTALHVCAIGTEFMAGDRLFDAPCASWRLVTRRTPLYSLGMMILYIFGAGQVAADLVVPTAHVCALLMHSDLEAASSAFIGTYLHVFRGRAIDAAHGSCSLVYALLRVGLCDVLAASPPPVPVPPALAPSLPPLCLGVVSTHDVDADVDDYFKHR